MGNSTMNTLWMMIVVAATVAVAVVESQPEQSCVAALTPCAEFLNATNPPASCCDPLRDAITNDLKCLCNLYQNPSFFASLNINVTQALELPGHCRIPGDLSACKADGPSSSSTPPPPGEPGNDGNGLGWSAWTAMWSFLLLCFGFL